MPSTKTVGSGIGLFMHASRLAKLAALTQGVALLGSLGAGCDKSQSGVPTQPPMINAPPTQTPEAMSRGDASSDSAAPTGALPTRRLPIPNAPPGRFKTSDADAAPSQK